MIIHEIFQFDLFVLPLRMREDPAQSCVELLREDDDTTNEGKGPELEHWLWAPASGGDYLGRINWQNWFEIAQERLAAYRFRSQPPAAFPLSIPHDPQAIPKPSQAKPSNPTAAYSIMLHLTPHFDLQFRRSFQRFACR